MHNYSHVYSVAMLIKSPQLCIHSYIYTVAVLVKTPQVDDNMIKLVCVVYGQSLEPVWSHGNTVLQKNRKHTITVTNGEFMNSNSSTHTEMVESCLRITHVTEEDLGEYTCSVPGNSSTVVVYAVFEGIIHTCSHKA